MGNGRLQESNHTGSLPRWVPDTSKNNSLEAISISQNLYFYFVCNSSSYTLRIKERTENIHIRPCVKWPLTRSGSLWEVRTERRWRCFKYAVAYDMWSHSEFGITIRLKKTKLLGQEVSRHPKYLHRRLHSQGGGGLQLPRFHHLQQPLPRHWTEQRGSGTTPCWPSATRWRYTWPACWARCSVVARPGPSTPTKRPDSTPSTCTASEGF